MTEKLNVLRGTNEERISKILFNNEIWPYVFNDAYQKERLVQNMHIFKRKEAVCYLFSRGDEDVGIGVIRVFPLIKFGLVDIGFLPDARGKIAKDAAIEAIADYRQHAPDVQLLSKVRKDNKRALGFNRMCGFRRFKEDQELYYMRYVK